jgi:hypothetical protein
MAGPKVQESIAKINACFPDEAVKFSDPQYARCVGGLRVRAPPAGPFAPAPRMLHRARGQHLHRMVWPRVPAACAGSCWLAWIASERGATLRLTAPSALRRQASRLHRRPRILA